MKPILTPVVLGAALLTGCATTTSFSQLTGDRWLRSELNTFNVTIISVDERHYIERRGQPVRIDPGMRTIVVQGPPTGGFRDGEQRALKLDVQPCTLYHLEARKTSSLAQDFEPRVNHTQPIAGCGVKK